MRVDELVGKSLFVTTPVYNLQCHTNYVNGLLNLASLCRAYEVQLQINFVHDSLVTRARNRQADLFLSSSSTHQMFIDSDIEFDGADVLKLLCMNEEFVCGAYPKKQMNWARAKRAIKMNPEIEPRDLEVLCGDFVFNIVGTRTSPEITTIRLDELNEITDAGTGFMLLNRSVYEKLIAANAVKSYTPMSDEQSFYGPKIYDFFRAEVDPASDYYLSEDYYFSRLWKSIGGKVWMAPFVKLKHWGTYCYAGNLVAIADSGIAQAEIDEKLAINPDIKVTEAISRPQSIRDTVSAEAK